MNNEYLTEKSLGEFLSEFFKGCEIIHNKQSIDGMKIRPDYFIKEYNIVVEFDGPQHYQSNELVIKDASRDKQLNSLGIKVVRIPYYIQLCSRIKTLYFFDLLVERTGKTEEEIWTSYDWLEDFNQFPHGFHSSKCPLPGTFSSLGFVKFENDLLYIVRNQDKGHKIVSQIQHSLFHKAFYAGKPLLDCFPTIFQPAGSSLLCLSDLNMSMRYWIGEEECKKFLEDGDMQKFKTKHKDSYELTLSI